MSRAWAALAIALTGCTVPFPLEVHASADEWSSDELALIADAAGAWQDVGSGLHLVIVNGPVAHECNGNWCGVYPSPVFQERHCVGVTGPSGVRIDRDHAVTEFGMEGLRRAMMHEFGHVNGLGSPADDQDHVHVVGDVMAPNVEEVMLGDGKLSEADAVGMVTYRMLRR